MMIEDDSSPGGRKLFGSPGIDPELDGEEAVAAVAAVAEELAPSLAAPAQGSGKKAEAAKEEEVEFVGSTPTPTLTLTPYP